MKERRVEERMNGWEWDEWMDLERSIGYCDLTLWSSPVSNSCSPLEL